MLLPLIIVLPEIVPLPQLVALAKHAGTVPCCVKPRTIKVNNAPFVPMTVPCAWWKGGGSANDIVVSEVAVLD